MHITHTTKIKRLQILSLLPLFILLSCSGSSSNNKQIDKIDLSQNSFISSQNNNFCFDNACNDKLINIKVVNISNSSQLIEVFLNQNFYPFEAISAFQFFFEFDKNTYNHSQVSFNMNLEGASTCLEISDGKTCYWMDTFNMVNSYNSQSSKILSFNLSKKDSSANKVSIYFRADGGEYMSLINSSSITYIF
jgi:hypothetical protein